VIEAAPRREVAQDLLEVGVQRAAEAAVVELDELLAARDRLAVDADRAELVDDDRDAEAVLLMEEVVQQRRLAAAEEAADDRGRDARTTLPWS
jgi:hypothetical protein